MCNCPGMMWHTHAAMGASTVCLLLPLLPPEDSSVVAVLMGFTVVGAMMPDLDAVESKIKHVQVMDIKPFVSISRAINRDLGHRGLLHSLWGWVGWTLLILPLGVITHWYCVIALSLGYASHLAGDACTRTGIPLLYPWRTNFYLPPVWLRVVTGSEMEEVFFVIFALISMAMLLRS